MDLRSTITERIGDHAAQIEAWLRSNGSTYLTTARHAVRWPEDASALDVTAAINLLIDEGRVVIVEGGITGSGLRVPHVWPEWVERLQNGSVLDLSTRIALGRCKRADGEAVAA